MGRHVAEARGPGARVLGTEGSDMAALAFDLTIRPVQTLHPSPDLVTYAELLVMGSQELETRVEEELAANPALAAPELWSCPSCGTERTTERCLTCETSWVTGAVPSATAIAAGLAAGARPEPSSAQSEPPDTLTEADRLVAAARLMLPAEDRGLVDLLVAELDDDGYLRTTLPVLAASLGVAPARLEQALHALRAAGPPAIGAGDCRESLLLQLAALEPSPVRALATAIVRDHLVTLARGHLGAIAAATGTTTEAVIDAREEIRTSLEPRPLAALHEPLQVGPPRIRPDVIVTTWPENPTRFSVEVVTAPRTAVGLDSTYAALASTRPVISGDLATLSLGERREIVEQVQRARSFVARLRDRHRTLERIARLVVDRQAAFVRFGPQFLQPVTRARIAAELGLSESTVSRATARKTVQLPSGRIVPFGNFFDPSLAVQEVLRTVLEDEDRPMTDADLAAGMRARGYRLARRTIAKYRLSLGVPTAAIRRVDRLTAGERFFA
jgi:RNA polymerase sigma-54 factor